MPTAYTRSGVQGTNSLDTFTTLYNTTSGKTGVLSTIAVCNTGNADELFRIGFTTTSSSATPNSSEWLVYDSTVGGNETEFLTLGISIPQNTFIRGSSSASTVVFQSFISEIT
jgi:hypothetical protein